MIKKAAKSSLKTSVRIDEKVNADYDKMADESKLSKTYHVNAALALYRDVYYSKNKATFLNDNILTTMQGMIDSMEHRLNNRTNQLLSELAIQQAVIAQVLGDSLDVKGDQLAEYRKKAVDYIKVNQRILRLDDVND